MAKSTKSKKVKESEITEPIENIDIPVIEETAIPEIGEQPPSVTLDEVKEVDEPPMVEEAAKVIPEPVKEEPKEVFTEIKLNDDLELSMEQKIINFIESRPSGEIRMNDFLKSMFPVPKFGEPPLWMNKGENKRLRLVLEDLQRKGYVNFISNTHLKLGQFYHDGDGQHTKHYNLGTINLVAKK